MGNQTTFDSTLSDDRVKEFRNIDYSEWVQLMELHPRFRNHRQSDIESGYEELYRLRDGFFIRILDLTIHKPNEVDLSFAGGHLLCCFKLKGTNTLRSSSGDEIRLAPGTAAVYYYEDDEVMYDGCDGDSDYLFVMLVIDPSVFIDPPLSIPLESIPDVLAPAFLATPKPIEFSFSFGPATLSAATDLVEHRVTGEHQRTYLEAKSTELLCLLLHDVALLEANFHLESIPPDDLQAIHRVKRRIDDSLQDLPSIDEIARDILFPVSRLKTGFKSLFGMTVGSYIKAVRMQKAQQLLAKGSLTIDRIAWELGYNHASNFTTAFKNQFGITPKSFQSHPISAPRRRPDPKS